MVSSLYWTLEPECQTLFCAPNTTPLLLGAELHGLTVITPKQGNQSQWNVMSHAIQYPYRLYPRIGSPYIRASRSSRGIYLGLKGLTVSRRWALRMDEYTGARVPTSIILSSCWSRCRPPQYDGIWRQTNHMIMHLLLAAQVPATTLRSTSAAANSHCPFFPRSIGRHVGSYVVPVWVRYSPKDNYIEACGYTALD